MRNAARILKMLHAADAIKNQASVRVRKSSKKSELFL